MSRAWRKREGETHLFEPRFRPKIQELFEKLCGELRVADGGMVRTDLKSLVAFLRHRAHHHTPNAYARELRSHLEPRSSLAFVKVLSVDDDVQSLRSAERQILLHPSSLDDHGNAPARGTS